MKNKYFLSLLSKILDRFANVWHFIKIDIRNAYYRIRIRKNDEWKTAFRIRYKQFEYQIIFFDLVNASAIFQFYVNDALKSYIDIYCVIYLNDVLIYSNSKEQHWKNVRKILKALLKYRLYVKLKKYIFNRQKVSFLSFVVKQHDIQIKKSRIDVVVEWLESKSVKNILIFLEFARFYRRFVKEFSQIATSLINLIKEIKKSKIHTVFFMIEEARQTFQKLKRMFINASIL